MRPIRAPALAAALAAAAAAGCGRTGRASDAMALRHGRLIFARSCAGCHTLAGRESGAIGGELVIAHLTVADLASFAKVMPTPTRLSSADVLAVAEYVHSVASTAVRRGH